MTPSLINRVRYARMASAVERAHVKPHLLRYSVGHHTHDGVSLLVMCWQHAHEGALPRAELIVAMHAHDHPEIILGDIPSPTKDLLGEVIEEVEQTALKWEGFTFELTEEEKLYLNAADRFELYLWCFEELQRGNGNFMDWANGYESKWDKDDSLPWPFRELLDEYTMKALDTITNVQLAEIGGMQ